MDLHGVHMILYMYVPSLHQRVTYAELEHSQHRPVAAWSQENGEDTEAMQVRLHGLTLGARLILIFM